MEVMEPGSGERMGLDVVRWREPATGGDFTQSWERGARTRSRKAAKKARKEFCEAFLNRKGQAAAVNEAVLAGASGWCQSAAGVNEAVLAGASGWC